MKIYKAIEDSVRYISGAVARIFGPTDDAYPATGVQPFEGEPSKRSKGSKRSRAKDWS
ncbi:hypothetical protein [Leptolyngbya sp. 'hensonii']|uniref:hypothetical protein n=1 Tax=Leptolyngbya sp. 'hensonii' TaxID=1922337 RepID=UPI000ADF98F7|nr:hypothetical protein [Leptolyngbya sp. 'hensonii']